MIHTQDVHIITFQGREFDRKATPWEIAQRKKEGVLKVHKTGLVFDFRDY